MIAGMTAGEEEAVSYQLSAISYQLTETPFLNSCNAVFPLCSCVPES
jgi:hypothetical protein